MYARYTRYTRVVTVVIEILFRSILHPSQILPRIFLSSILAPTYGSGAGKFLSGCMESNFLDEFKFAGGSKEQHSKNHFHRLQLWFQVPLTEPPPDAIPIFLSSFPRFSRENLFNDSNLQISLIIPGYWIRW